MNTVTYTGEQSRSPTLSEFLSTGPALDCDGAATFASAVVSPAGSTFPLLPVVIVTCAPKAAWAILQGIGSPPSPLVGEVGGEDCAAFLNLTRAREEALARHENITQRSCAI